MKLTVLLDNNAIIDRYLLSEPGLSFLLEDSGKRIRTEQRKDRQTAAHMPPFCPY